MELASAEETSSSVHVCSCNNAVASRDKHDMVPKKRLKYMEWQLLYI